MGLNVNDVLRVDRITFTCSKGNLLDTGITVNKAKMVTTKGSPYPRVVCEVLDPYNIIGRELKLDGSEKNVTFIVHTPRGSVGFRNMVFEKDENTDNSMYPPSDPMSGTGHFQIHTLHMVAQDLENANKNLVPDNFINETPTSIVQKIASKYWQSPYSVLTTIMAKPVSLNAGNKHSKDVIERLAGMFDTTHAGRNGDSLMDLYFYRKGNAYILNPFSASFNNQISGVYTQYDQLAGSTLNERDSANKILNYKVKGFLNVDGKVLRVTRHISYNLATGELTFPFPILNRFAMTSGTPIVKDEFALKPHVVFAKNDPANNETPGLLLGTAAENRVRYLADLNQCSIEFTIPVDPGIDIGDMVQLNIHEKNARENGSSLGHISSYDSNIYSIIYELDLNSNYYTFLQRVTTLKPTQRI